MRPLRELLDAPARKRKAQACADPPATLSKSCEHNLRKGLADVLKAGGDPEKESRPFLNAVFGFWGWLAIFTLNSQSSFKMRFQL